MRSVSHTTKPTTCDQSHDQTITCDQSHDQTITCDQSHDQNHNMRSVTRLNPQHAISHTTNPQHAISHTTKPTTCDQSHDQPITCDQSHDAFISLIAFNINHQLSQRLTHSSSYSLTFTIMQTLLSSFLILTTFKMRDIQHYNQLLRNRSHYEAWLTILLHDQSHDTTRHHHKISFTFSITFQKIDFFFFHIFIFQCPRSI